MNREEIIAEIFENITSFKHAMISRGPHPHPKGMPTHAQLGVLFMISHHGPQNIKQIAEKFRITPSAATQFVDSLVKEKLLIRKEDDKDRRKIYVALTNVGKKKLQQANMHRIIKIKKMFEPLSKEELIQLKNIYSKITDRIK